MLSYAISGDVDRSVPDERERERERERRVFPLASEIRKRAFTGRRRSANGRFGKDAAI